jgi:hypothetical protein
MNTDKGNDRKSIPRSFNFSDYSERTKAFNAAKNIVTGNNV